MVPSGMLIRHVHLMSTLCTILFSYPRNGNGGVTSSFVRSQWPSVDMPLDSEAFAIPKGYNAPEQVHITQGDYEGKAVIVSWVTPLEPGSSEVHYGTIQDNYDHRAEGNMTIYAFYNYTSGFIHHCLIDDLEYGTKYYYKIGNGSSARHFWFFTPPSIDPDAAYTFGIIGDMGQTFNSRSTFEHYMQSNGQTVLYVGDLSYADNYEYDNGVRWDTWGRFVEPSTAYQPWIWTAGNHEIEFRPKLVEDGGIEHKVKGKFKEMSFESSAVTITMMLGRYYNSSHQWLFAQCYCYANSTESSKSCLESEEIKVPKLNGKYMWEGKVLPFEPYLHRYQVPYISCGSTSPLWYAIKRASTHIIVLSSYSPFGKYTPQWAWLRSELQRVDREKTPWLIVLMHAPLYNSNNFHYMEGESMRVVFEPWFVKHKVDIIFAGHVHAYERSYRISNIEYNITNGNCAPIQETYAPVYITVGDGGNLEGLAGQFREPQPTYSAFREASYGHGMLEIKNRSHAYYYWNRNDDGVSVASDSFWFYNQYWWSKRQLYPRRRLKKKHTGMHIRH